MPLSASATRLCVSGGAARQRQLCEAPGATGASAIAAPASASSASSDKERNNDMSLTYSEWKNPGIPMRAGRGAARSRSTSYYTSVVTNRIDFILGDKTSSAGGSLMNLFFRCLHHVEIMICS